MRDGRNQDEDDSEIRSKIYDYIEKNPGAHLRMITRELQLGMGATQHHLDVLEKSGRIKSRRINVYRHYFVMRVLDKEHHILAFLRQETARDILVYLLEHPWSTQSDIIKFKGFSAPTISWHMSRLEEAELVRSIKEGRTMKYSIIDNQSIAAALKTYHANIWDKLLSRFAELFIQISSETKEEDD
ncbi:MAG: winged helix-turn-helix transcriptional regulator [Thaumarchaeota archaeon]|nr:winged helix-turn-helix transcriptional regulator [Nitrososphaerota archaeon]MDE1872726.1 winged helix-turn-helix transcriptional regulator [Nitrososphaerota archaeon]